MKNNIPEQYVVVDQGRPNPNQTLKSIALFDSTGTPYANGNSTPPLKLIDATLFGVVADNLTDNTVGLNDAIQAAFSMGGGLVVIPPGTTKHSGTLTLRNRTGIIGHGVDVSTLAYTGVGTGVASISPGVRTYNFRLEDLTITALSSNEYAVNFDSVSLARIVNVKVRMNGLTSGIAAFRFGSSINGGAVYNHFDMVEFRSSSIGLLIDTSGSNEATILGGRALLCGIGISIVGSNHTKIIGPSIEGCNTGIKISSPTVAASDRNFIITPRFEGCTLNIDIADVNVRYTAIIAPAHVDGTNINDLSPSTANLALGGGQTSINIKSQAQTSPFYFERIANGGTEQIAMHVNDSVTSTGTPVTIQATTERALGIPFRAVRAGATQWEVNAQGIMRFPSNTGYIELSEISSAGSGAADKARLFCRDNGSGKSQLCVQFGSGTFQVIATEP